MNYLPVSSSVRRIVIVCGRLEVCICIFLHFSPTLAASSLHQGHLSLSLLRRLLCRWFWDVYTIYNFYFPNKPMQISKKLTGCVSTHTPGLTRSSWVWPVQMLIPWPIQERHLMAGRRFETLHVSWRGLDHTIWCFYYCCISSYQLILLYSSLETKDPHPLSLLLTILHSRSIEFSSQLSVFLWQKTVDNRAISLDGRTA